MFSLSLSLSLSFLLDFFMKFVHPLSYYWLTHVFFDAIIFFFIILFATLNTFNVVDQILGKIIL